jgi:transcriptional regulator with XRE-family HTH domain
MRTCEVPKLSSTLGVVSEDELQKVLNGLRKWAKGSHGRQKQLAKALDVTEQTLSNWLSGRKRPSLGKFFALRAFLKRQSSKES